MNLAARHTSTDPMSTIPILQIDGILLITMQENLSDTETDGLLMLVGKRVVEYSAQGVLLDLSAVTMVDSYMGRTLISIARAVGLLGAETVLTGIRPAVAITIVELGMDFAGLGAAANLQLGLEDLRARIGSRR